MLDTEVPEVPEVNYPLMQSDHNLVEKLRAGDEQAFAAVVSRLHPFLVRLARLHVGDFGIAEEIAQEAWVTLLERLDRFEERSSLKTWLAGIVLNKARTRGVREKRQVAFSALAGQEIDEPFSAVAASRFLPPDHLQWPGHWTADPSKPPDPESSLLQEESMRIIEKALATLPEAQRAVFILRDVEGESTEEICNVLQISETNVRVLLHRARAKVRAALEQTWKR